MGLIYEHWRLDTNECFYIGKAEGKNPYARAYSLKPRNKDHGVIVAELEPLGLIDVRYSEFPDIAKESLNNLEILMIAHHKMYVGNRLTNKAKGGNGGDTFSWLDEKQYADRCAKLKLSQAVFRETDDYNNYVETLRKKSLIAWKDKNRIEGQRIRITKAWSDKRLINEQKIRTTASWKDPEIRTRRVDGINRPEAIKANSSKVSALWQTQMYRDKMMCHAWWLSNVRDRKYWGA